MNIVPHKITVRELIEGYEDNEEGGVVGYGGKLDIRPAYQREFVYRDKQRDLVIDTLTKGYPLNVMYWAERDDVFGDDSERAYEVMDGQQRTISICQYVEGDFSFQGRYFGNLQPDEREQVLNYELTVYLCAGTPSEKLAWFETINIAGVTLSQQELRNAVFHGPWVSDAKRYFSRRNCPAEGLAGKYMNGEYIRQKYLETAIKWINADSKAKDPVQEYMAEHQHDPTAVELWNYFQSVISWVKATFPVYRTEMKGLPWGPYFNTYKHLKLEPAALGAEVDALMADPAVTSRKGIFEYLLSGKTRPELLSIRLFDEKTKAVAYERQTQKAKGTGVSNCPLCAHGDSVNKTRIYERDEMDADHVTAWSKGGATDLANLTMLCQTHNRAKGNR